jgi:hypothetical protein
MSATCLDEPEAEFFQAVHALMRNKFPDMEEKFGMWRAHQHFETKADEVLHETSDARTRESTLRIIKKNDLPAGAFVSTWKLSPSGGIPQTYCCDYDDYSTPA